MRADLVVRLVRARETRGRWRLLLSRALRTLDAPELGLVPTFGDELGVPARGATRELCRAAEPFTASSLRGLTFGARDLLQIAEHLNSKGTRPFLHRKAFGAATLLCLKERTLAFAPCFRELRAHAPNAIAQLASSQHCLSIGARHDILL
ncbi:MAG: hypothetical protein ACRELY_03810 [Polyangiaceae bacterium]